MAFCTKCGKELTDGEICSCETAGKKANPAEGLVGEIVGAAKDIVQDPKEGAKRFVDNISWLGMSVLAAIYAVINVLYGVWYKVKANIDRKNQIEDWADDLDMDFEDYVDDFDVDVAAYDGGEIFKGVFMDILEVAAGIAIVAVVLFFAVKLFKKIQLTWKSAFAIATIELLVAIPFVLAYRILDFIPDFKLLSWIMVAISLVKGWCMTILTYLALKSVCKDTKSTVYVYVPSLAVISFATSLIFFILNSIF